MAMGTPLLLVLVLVPFTACLTFPPHQIHPLLHRQALSHLAFHSSALKLHLSRLTSPSIAVVVGVEWATEVITLAASGARVYAFEPLPLYLAHLRRLAASNPAWDLRILPLAATSPDVSGNITVEYQGAAESVRAGTVDEFVAEPVGLLSVDVQGAELQVLRGATALLERVQMVWVEAIACEASVPGVLELLGESFVVFDFVPWGKRNGSAEGVPRERGSFVFEEGRPGGYAQYVEWMCRKREEGYEWLQTDFMAVRRQVVTEEFVERLQGVAEEVCGEGKDKADCVLKRMVEEERGNTRGKQEL